MNIANLTTQPPGYETIHCSGGELFPLLDSLSAQGKACVSLSVKGADYVLVVKRAEPATQPMMVNELRSDTA